MRRVIATLASVILVACGDDGGTGPQGLILSRAATSGDGQTGAPGTVLSPFRVQLTNDGVPVEGTIINWAVTSGGEGTLDVPTSVTDASGFASATLTLGQTAGQTTVTASGDRRQRLSGQSSPAPRSSRDCSSRSNVVNNQFHAGRRHHPARRNGPLPLGRPARGTTTSSRFRRRPSPASRPCATGRSPTRRRSTRRAPTGTSARCMATAGSGMRGEVVVQ